MEWPDYDGPEMVNVLELTERPDYTPAVLLHYHYYGDGFHVVPVLKALATAIRSLGSSGEIDVFHNSLGYDRLGGSFVFVTEQPSERLPLEQLIPFLRRALRTVSPHVFERHHSILRRLDHTRGQLLLEFFELVASHGHLALAVLLVRFLAR